MDQQKPQKSIKEKQQQIAIWFAVVFIAVAVFKFVFAGSSTPHGTFQDSASALSRDHEIAVLNQQLLNSHQRIIQNTSKW